MADIGKLWECQPRAAEVIERTVESWTGRVEFVAQLRNRLISETGTRLVDWIDHVSISAASWAMPEEAQTTLEQVGFQAAEECGQVVLRHEEGLFPAVVIGGAKDGLGLKVESVSQFLNAHQIATPINGAPGTSLRMATVSEADDYVVKVVERWGNRGWSISNSEIDLRTRSEWFESVLLRRRDSRSKNGGFGEAERLIDAGVQLLGQDEACALFFHAERMYWMGRNRAAQIQKMRQDQLGLGWANHDHHTYRSSRAAFQSLMRALLALGFEYRERFYAGEEAGWGAQVLEQRNAGITVFADVDLAPEEIVEDFPTLGLDDREELGTVGLWCALHGEAFLEAGMHHLECQFDFTEAREQLAELGVDSMQPFTDFDFLKQCFTAGETWKVAPDRVHELKATGRLSAQQAQQFIEQGALGSHLEILQRDDGFKGFNQTGISDIIRKTDPRQIQ